MTKNAKFIVGGLVGVVVLGVAYFGGGGMFQGKLQGDNPVTRAEIMKMLAIMMNDKFGDFVSVTQKGCPVFSDLKSDHWAFKSVCYMWKKRIRWEKNLVYKYYDDTFDPNGTLTRSEIAKLLSVVYGGGGMGGNYPNAIFPEGLPYADIPEDHWIRMEGYDVYVAKLGFTDIEGWAGKNFGPDATLSKTRAQGWVDNLKKALNK